MSFSFGVTRRCSGASVLRRANGTADSLTFFSLPSLIGYGNSGGLHDQSASFPLAFSLFPTLSNNSSIKDLFLELIGLVTHLIGRHDSGVSLALPSQTLSAGSFQAGR